MILNKNEIQSIILTLPSRCSGIEREGNKELSRILLIRFKPQRLLLNIHIVPNSHCLLMFHKWSNWVVGDCTRTIRGRSINPVAGGRVDPTTHVIRRRIRAHQGRWLRVVSGVLVVLGRVRVGVWCGSSKHISVFGYFRLRRRLTLVATVVPPPARTTASIISHSVLQQFSNFRS